MVQNVDKCHNLTSANVVGGNKGSTGAEGGLKLQLLEVLRAAPSGLKRQPPEVQLHHPKGRFQEKGVVSFLRWGALSGVLVDLKQISVISKSEKKNKRLSGTPLLCHWGSSTYLLVQL